jgi:hypothetical protein
LGNTLYDTVKDFAAPGVALIGIIVTGTMAGLGLRSFSKFKREKIEERRIELAIDALALTYESRFVFDTIRARAIRRHEYEDAADEIAEGIQVPVLIREGQRGAYAVMKRIQAQGDFFEKLYKIEPQFMAVFGPKTSEIFSMVYSARTELQASAEQLFEMGLAENDSEGQPSREEKRKLREVIFRGPTETKEKDKIGDLVDGFRTRIETICRPVVDHQYGKEKSPS